MQFAHAAIQHHLPRGQTVSPKIMWLDTEADLRVSRPNLRHGSAPGRQSKAAQSIRQSTLLRRHRAWIVEMQPVQSTPYRHRQTRSRDEQKPTESASPGPAQE